MVGLWPGVAAPELRVLVREMLENLGAVNQIGEGVALENYEQVERAALDLVSRAARLKEIDISTLGLDPARDDQFDAYLTAQEGAARAIASAARAKDGQASVLGVQQLLASSCLSCHADFREGAQLLSPSVLFMTTFMSAWKEMNRGLSINDFTLVGRSAREIQALSRVLAWDQVIQSTFELNGSDERKQFRSHLARVTAQAARIEQASFQEDAPTILQATRQMWNEGCLACHDQFR